MLLGGIARFLLIWFSQVFAIAQAVTTQLATNHGLGKHRNKLSAHDFLEYSKVSNPQRLGGRQHEKPFPDVRSSTMRASY